MLTAAPTLLVIARAFSAAVDASLAFSAFGSLKAEAGAVVVWPSAHCLAAAAESAATFQEIFALPVLPPRSDDQKFQAPLSDPVCEKTTYILRITHCQ